MVLSGVLVWWSLLSTLVRVATVLRVIRPATTPARPQMAKNATGRRRA
jgi:hypothetical protein